MYLKRPRRRQSPTVYTTHHLGGVLRKDDPEVGYTREIEYTATGEWAENSMIRHFTQEQRKEKVNALVKEGRDKGLLKELPLDLEGVYGFIEVLGRGDHLLQQWAVPNEQAWQWWVDRLGLERIG